MSISFVTIDEFRPDVAPWVPVGPVAAVDQSSGDFLLKLRDAPLTIRLSVLSSTCLRVRFDPRPEAISERDVPCRRRSAAGSGGSACRR